MSGPRDPVEARDREGTDRYEVTTWEVRTPLDRIATILYGLLVSGLRALVVVVAVAILALQVLVGGFGALTDPIVGAFALLSVVPAFLLALYLWTADVTTKEPLSLLVATFMLGFLFAGFAAVLNTLTSLAVEDLGLTVGTVGFVTQVALFYVVVGPVEESVKLLAVRLYPFRNPRFDAVIDGAVYGAVAGLGFATVENLVYVSGAVGDVSDPLNLVGVSAAVSTVRALAGPGHVIYSAFAGYYLGLAKFNPERAGPIVVKGLLIASLIHSTYNTLAGVVPGLVSDALGIPWLLAFVGFVVVFDGLFGLALLAKIERYRRAYHEVHDVEPGGPAPESTEFDA